MRLVIVTGMSGAGKTNALKMLEDMGFYCVDNLPIPLIQKFAELTLRNQLGIKNVALGVDIRSGDELGNLSRIFDNWSRNHMPFEIVFLEADDQTLIKRYKETRRAHPLAGEGRVENGIREERIKLRFLKEEADYIIDTSKLLTKELKKELEKIFIENEVYQNLYVTILSFGFKYGIPTDADLVFDVRFLPNPFYVEDLRDKTGENQEVREFVSQHGTAGIFLEKLYDMLMFLIPNNVLEGKNQLVVAIGCTGGRHRSVTIAKGIYDRLKTHEELGLKMEHRDIDKDNKRKRND